MLPENLRTLHQNEEFLRQKSNEIIRKDADLQLHLQTTEAAMDVADTLRKHPTNDEDLKVKILLGMRVFNAFASATKLTLSGYHQNAALILRDVLETTFLVDYFNRVPAKIKAWRFADEKQIRNEFSPVTIRKALDEMDGFEGQKRAEHYKLFSQLAAHPTMKSSWMMRPEKDGDAMIGPFIGHLSLAAVLGEMGRLAVLSGNTIMLSFPENCEDGLLTRQSFNLKAKEWIEKFFS